ncbi:hypothetical protein EVAR_78622_1 [Eumeta japonica]|uniref:Uncharacterized protein n=1 Tax=Eumeta variegata TaxID=151549 RepID=A0A4C1U977_EUMVA|nr:hypothetical protein EVAR_78622_1 [Eumeta japonica]
MQYTAISSAFGSDAVCGGGGVACGVLRLREDIPSAVRQQRPQLQQRVRVRVSQQAFTAARTSASFVSGTLRRKPIERRVTCAMNDAWRKSSRHRMSQETVTGRFPSLLPGRRRLAAAGWSKGAYVDDLTNG